MWGIQRLVNRINPSLSTQTIAVSLKHFQNIWEYIFPTMATLSVNHNLKCLISCWPVCSYFIKWIKSSAPRPKYLPTTWKPQEQIDNCLGTFVESCDTRLLHLTFYPYSTNQYKQKEFTFSSYVVKGQIWVFT